MRCILTALSCLHQHGFVHRDIRWENVVKLINGNWMLIDLEHAGREGIVSYEKLLNWPNLQEGGYDGYMSNCFVDLYAVGKLLESCHIVLDNVGIQFKDKLLGSLTDKWSANEALTHDWLSN